MNSQILASRICHWLVNKSIQDSRFIRQSVYDCFRSPAPSLTPYTGAWDHQSVYFSWIGHSTVLMSIEGINVITDPVLFSRIGPNIMGINIGPKRFIHPALQFDKLPHIHVVLLSHAHMDHLDIASLQKIDSEFVVFPMGAADLLYGLNKLGKHIELTSDQDLFLNTSSGELSVCSLPVNHKGQRWRFDTGRSCNSYLLQKNKISIFFGGDTAFCPNLKKKLSNYDIDVALMPIGAYNPWQHNHCTPEEALLMSETCTNVLPIHWNTFKLSKEPRQEPIARFTRFSDTRQNKVKWNIGDEIQFNKMASATCNKHKSARILVTETHLRFGFNVVRSLVNSGHKCIVASPQKNTMCRRLPGVIAEVRYPSPFVDEAGFVDTLADAANHFDCEIIIPGHEDTFVVSRHRHRLPENIKVAAPEIDSIFRINDKLKVYQHATALGIACPQTLGAANTDELMAAIEKIGYPCIVKPRFGEGGLGQYRLPDKSSLERNLEKITGSLQQIPYLVQSYIKGKGCGVSALRIDSRIIAMCGHMRVREIPREGGTSCARIVFNHEPVYSKTEQLLSNFDFNGVAMVEYRYSPDDETFYLLEVNPRYWGSLATAIAAGVDFPRLHVRALLGEQLPKNTVVPSVSVESRWFLGEIATLLSKQDKFVTDFPGKLDHTKHTVIYEDLNTVGFREMYAQIRAYIIRASRQKSLLEAKNLFFNKLYLEKY